MFKLPFSGKKLQKKHIIIAVLIVAALIVTLYQRQRIINEKILTYTESLSQYEERFSHYYYDDYKSSYNTIIGNYKSGLDSKDLSVLEDCVLQLDSLESKVIKENTSLFEEKIENLENANLMNAYDEELEKIARIQTDVHDKMENHLFTDITPLIEEWTTILSDMTVIADNLSIYVNQTDTSNYPQVSIYLSVHDIKKNKTPADLEKEYLYLTEHLLTDKVTSESASAAAVADIEVLQMKQLNNNLPLSISILADMSGSKTEEETKEIINGISAFLDKVQFNVNDQIEIVSVSDTISICQEFSSNKEEILTSLSSLSASNSSSHLYDGLIEAITRSAANSGAKCVIAFTDGEDTGSTHTWEEVVALSKEYGIPVFLIGIGKEVSPYILERIGQKTNGFYRNINDFSSLDKIFKNIYVKMKKLYKVEFISGLADNTTDSRSLTIAYQHRDFGGTCDYIYAPVLKDEEIETETSE